MRDLVAALLLSSSLFACATTSNRAVLPGDQGLRSALTGDFFGFWTGAASGTILRSKDGALLEVPIVLAADLASDVHWDMDATDFGEFLLEKAGHFNSAVWFVATQIEVAGHRVYITKFEESYEDTLCLELVGLESDGAMRFQARSFLADPGQGPRDECLAGSAQYDATLLLNRGVSAAPEFIESGRNGDGPERFGAEPPDSGEDYNFDDGSTDEDTDSSTDEGDDI